MKTTQLTVSDPKYLAEFIREDELKTFFESRYEVPPDHLGLLMRNGQFVQAYKGAHFSVGLGTVVLCWVATMCWRLAKKSLVTLIAAFSAEAGSV